MAGGDGPSDDRADRTADDDVAEEVHVVAHARPADEARKRVRRHARFPAVVTVEHSGGRESRGRMPGWKPVAAAARPRAIDGNFEDGGHQSIEDLGSNEIAADMGDSLVVADRADRIRRQCQSALYPAVSDDHAEIGVVRVALAAGPV